MAFKIPKKKRQGAEPETDIVVMQSPLSSLQDSASVATNGWGVANGARGRPNTTGKEGSFRDAMQRPAVNENLRSRIRKLLEIAEPTRAGPVMSVANQRSSVTPCKTPSSNRASVGHGQSGQPSGTAPTQHAASNGWRPRRASDRLIEDDSQRRKDSVVSVDSSERDTPGRTSSDRPRDTGGQSQQGTPFRWHSSPSSSSSSSPSSSPIPALRTAPHPVLSTSLAPRKTIGGRLSLGARRTLGDDTRSSAFTRLGRPSAAPRKPTEPIVLSSEEEDMEDIACGVKTLDAPEGSRRVQDGAGAAETCSEASRTARTCSEDSRAVRTCSEVSWREETSSEGAWTVETSPAVRTCSEASRRVETTSERPWTVVTSPEVRTCSETSRTVETTSEGSRPVATSPEASRIVPDDVSPPPSSVGASSSSSTMELQFSRLLLGQLSAQAHGNLLITESCIFLPLKGLHIDSEVEAESLSVAVVTSQLRGYGVWEEGVAAGSHAPSLLFLWVTDSHAKLLQTELSVLQPVTAAEGACPFILVELTSPLAGLQLALLRSLLDMCGTAASCSMSVSVSHALALMHEHPLMLALLGHDTTGVSSRLKRRAANCLTTRLIQYPLTQGKGRIAVTLEDLSCLNEGEFLNDVIIDFYLKYLLLECSGNLSERCHVFSSFFYRQLTKRRTTEEETQPLDKVGRHQRVKTWTRNVDIFDKDFLFVPVNQEAHWYLVVVCFPGLVKDQLEETNSVSTTLHEEQRVKRPRLTRDMLPRGPPPVRSRGPPPECTMLGWKKETVLKRPCILVMDSLKRLSRHEKIENVCRLLREYMHVEWTQRRPSTRIFSSTTMKSASCTLPLQDNSSDCGLYLLQYVETFLKNPVVHFDLPVCLNNWFPRQLVRKKREEIRQLVMEMNQRQTSDQPL